MKRLEYQEETVERFTGYLETLVAECDAEKFFELAGQDPMEPPVVVVDWCGPTMHARLPVFNGGVQARMA